MERADEVHDRVMALLDQRFLEGGLSDAEEGLRILLHNVRNLSDRAWTYAMESLALAYLTEEERAALPGSSPSRAI